MTPNYNGKEFLKTYFDSLNRNKDFVGEVILVDNGSTDESIEFIKDYSRNLDFPVIIIRNAENLGFAKAVNQGISKSSYPYIFSLNNDTQVEESGIKPLIDLISSDDSIFSVASKMVQFDNKKLIDDAGDEYNILAWTKKTGENQPAENYDEVYERLEEMGYDVEEGYACPEAIIIRGGSSIESNELFKEGLITVQDESAMIVTPLLDVKVGDIVLDLCAAPGGKTTHIAELLNGEGKVYSFDLHENKLSLINENLERLGLKDVEVEAMDATKLNPKYVSFADKVLIDVPCSGLGIIRKKPEIKWNKSRKSLKDLVPTQREIMENAWTYLKSGGTMLYSTCTLNVEENQDNIEWFLNNHKDAKVEKIFLGNMDNFMYNNDGSLTILPNEYMDGFYVAKIIKK